MSRKKRKAGPAPPDDMAARRRYNGCRQLTLVFAGMFILLAVCSSLGSHLFTSTLAGVGDQANAFMEALRERDTERAFAMVAPDTQDQWQSDHYLLEYYQRPMDWYFSSFSVRNEVGRVSGSVTLEDGTTMGIIVRLINSPDGWLITDLVYE